MSSYAKLRNDLVTANAVIDGQEVVNIKDPLRGNYFRLRPPEFWLISQLDGETSYEQVAERFKSEFNLNIDANAVLQFVEVLESQYFLENSRSEQQVSRRSYGNEDRKSLFSKLLYIKFNAFNPGRFLDVLTKLYKPFHTPIGLTAQALFIFYGLILFFTHYASFSISLSEIYSVGSIITIVAALFVYLIIHEFSHAVACRLYGGEVSEIGFLFMYFQPCFYCNISDAWLFEKKRHRLAVTWAGSYSGFILLAISIIIWRVTVPGTFINQLSELIVVIIWVTFLLNFNPLIKLDGYYLLSDWLDIPNLRSKSFAYVGNMTKRILLGWPIEKIETTSRQRKIYIFYAMTASLYTTFILLYFFFILSSFLLEKMGITGLLLIFTVLLFTLRENIVDFFNGFIQHIKYLKDIMEKPFRLISYIVFIAILIGVLFLAPFPHRVTGKIVIEPIAEFSLLLNDLGLLEKKFRQGGAQSEMKTSYIQMASLELGSLDLIPYVKDAQNVSIGDTLAVLVSNQVTREIDAEQSVLKQLQSDMALLLSPPKKEEIDEAQSEVNASQAQYDQRIRDENLLKEMYDKNLEPKEKYNSAVSLSAIAKAELQNKKAKLRLLKSPPKPEEEAVILSKIQKQKARLDFLQTQKDAQSIVSMIPGTVVINQNDAQFLSVIDNSEIEILVPVSDFDIDLIHTNQEVHIKVRSYTSDIFTGRVVHIPRDAAIINDKAFFMVSVVIENEQDRLHKGMTGYAKIEIGDSSLFNLIIRRIASIIRVEFWSLW